MGSPGGGRRGRGAIVVVLQPSADRTDWYVRRERHRGDGIDRTLLSRGSLTYTEGRLAPRDLIADLRRIAFALERQYAQSRPEGAPEPPRGGYGGDQPLPGLQPPDWLVLHAGGALDSKP